MNTFDALIELQKQSKAEVFLVGGYVRDYLRGKKNDDLDVVVRKLSEEDIMKFLLEYGKVKKVTLARTNEDFAVNVMLFRAKGDTKEAQISLPRRNKPQIPSPSNTLRQDSKYRDFKINALYLPIDFKSRKDVIDHVGGLQGIALRRISPVTTAGECIAQSPIRILRAISLASRTGYKIDSGLITEIKKKANLLANEPVENLRRELNKILLCRKPSIYLRLMQKLGVLQYVIPELDRCVGVYQDKRYHKYDVFTHCIYTCDHAEPDLVLRLSGLLHDVGKPETRKVRDGRVTFHKHEVAGAVKAKGFLDRLRYDSRTKEQVLQLVRMHMYHYTREYTDAAVRRFIRKAGVTREDVRNLSEFPLFKLRSAERLGNGLKKDPVTKRQRDFEERIVEVFDRGADIELKDLDINGHILMEAFGLDSGKKVGEVLKYLLDRVQGDRELNTRYSLLELALAYLKSQEHNGG